MRKLFFVCGVLAAAVINVNGQQLSLDAMIERDLASWLSTYKMLHAAPGSLIARKDRCIRRRRAAQTRFTVTERIGKYQNAQWNGYGVAAVMKNGPGPTVLVRTELDALPVEEKTGVPTQAR